MFLILFYYSILKLKRNRAMLLLLSITEAAAWNLKKSN